jgi:hypothetical protein|tara:strand:- start:553 stop:747 length:195 start_codon:yes stop_codon:yes gene_type:complete
MKDKEFIEEVFEIAFGDSARCVPKETGLPREFTKEEVLERLMEFSDNALKWENTDDKDNKEEDK